MGGPELVQGAPVSSGAGASHRPPGHRGVGDGDRHQVPMGGVAKSFQEEKPWTVLPPTQHSHSRVHDK